MKKKSKLKTAVFDMEFDGFNPTKMHCTSANMRVGNTWKQSDTTDYDEARALFKWADIIIGHNIILFDVPQAEKILEIDIDNILIDTLALSWYLYPEKDVHGLEAWGKYFGTPKPEIDDWENLSIEEYLERCNEDVKINTQLFEKQITYLKNIYQRMGSFSHIIKYLTFKMECVARQERNKWKVDIEKARENFDMFFSHVEEVTSQLEAAMPEVPDMGEMKRPPQFKKNGEPTVRWEQWVERLEAQGLDPEEYEGDKLEYVKSYDPPNAASHVQVKNWLFSHGWDPATFDYKPDDREESGYRKIPQIKDGDDICESVKLLEKKEPKVKLLTDLSVAKHRSDILKRFIEDSDEDGYIKAQVAGVTNTLRFRHKTLVNLPGVTHKGDFSDGEYIRSCLVAPKGYELLGSDMSSLEDRTKQHFMYDYDPDFVKQMQVEGFDPHLDIGVSSGLITQEESDFYKDLKGKMKNNDFEASKEEMSRFYDIDERRHLSKTVNYSATYGAGAKNISLTSGKPLKEAKKMWEGYWDRNWAIKKIQEDAITQKVNGQMWLWNPVSKMWYSLRNKKDIFSTLNQGTGAFCFDLWLRYVLEESDKYEDSGMLLGQFHDEFILLVKEGERDMWTKILKEAITKVNNKLKLNVELDVDVQFGPTYADIH